MSESGFPAAEFPVAEVAAAKRPWWTTLSRMWLVTIVCLVFAIGLTWAAMRAPGTEIVIRFSEGHGLKPGDAVRHRGIDIGQVTKVRLRPGEEGIFVTAVLDVNASDIACEGSRFWIVRPQLDFTGISGLETAIGAKYIRVIPGRAGTRQSEFEGLSTRPADELGRSGVEIILRGDDRYGVNAGSPLTWRGVEVGQVLSSSLSPDAMHVDTRVRILDPHRRLLTRESKFWVTSGIQMGFDVTGFEFSAESLSTIARGGIAFITPGPSASGAAVQPGDVFTLHEKLDDQWVESATAVNLFHQQPPPMAIVTAAWKEKFFGITQSRLAHASALAIATVDGFALLLPADLAAPPAEAIEDSYRLTYVSQTNEYPLDVSTATNPTSEIAMVSLDGIQLTGSSLLSASRIRSPPNPEDCFVIRKSWRSGSESAVVTESIGKQELTEGDAIWRCTNSKLSRDLWHGAAVVASQDEKVIGMLVVSADGPVVAPLPISVIGD